MPSAAVRFRAACELAEQGRGEGKDVLKATLKGGGADGFRAYGLLKKLGESVPPPRTWLRCCRGTMRRCG
jgi:hypothetical protein